METETTVIETPERIHYLIGVGAKCATEINNTIPLMIITIDKSGIPTVIKNPRREYLTLSPGEGIVEFSAKTISLAGFSYPKEVFTKVSIVKGNFIEPTY